LVVGLGVDVVETARVERALARWGERFVVKLMGPEERGGLPEGGGRAAALACAIAAKEAASKAIGTGWSRGVGWKHVVVQLGPPAEVRLHGPAALAARRLGSSGATRTRMDSRRDGLVIARVILLS